MSDGFKRLLRSGVAPWWRGTSPRWSLAWGVTYVGLMATVIVLSLNQPPSVIGKRALALHAAFGFAAFFGASDLSEEYPRVIWERTYAALVALFCLMLLAQAAFAFAGVRWGVAWLAGASRAASAAPTSAALPSLAFGIAIYALMAAETRLFRRFALHLRRPPMRSA